MASNLPSAIKRRLRHPLYTLGPLLALIIIFIPLQHSFTLARFQHYGIAVLAWGLCYVLQTIWSWKKMRHWMRISYLFTGLYLSSAALFFYANPWFDINMSVETSSQQAFRHLLGYGYAALSLVMVWLWFFAYSEEAAQHKHDE